MTIEFKVDFLSVACNTVSDAVEWSTDWDLVAFAAHQMVALYRPVTKSSTGSMGLFSTLKGHTDRISALRLLKRGSGIDQKDVAILTASGDKSLRIWEMDELKNWSSSAVLNEHGAGILAIGVMQGQHIPSDADWFSSSSSDGVLKIWRRMNTADEESKFDKFEEAYRGLTTDTPDQVECFETIQLGSKYAMSLAMGCLPNTKTPFLITGGSDMQLHVYVLRDGQFERLVSLQGHTDWIRSIQIMTYTNTHENTSSAQHFKDGDLVIASASQDRYIRLWSVSQALTDGLSTQNDVTSNSTFDMMEALSGMAIGQDGVKMSTKAHVIQMEDGETRSNYVFMLHALLMGHEDWVHSVHWQPARKIGSLYHQPLALISASADKSLMIWSPEADSESWTYATRFGEMGGTTLGFYGGQFSPDGSQIIAHGYHGALQLWTKAGGKTHWDLSFGISGHQNKVQDLAWDPTGQYLLTTSLDQTTRLIGQWSRDGSETTWHEMARPQIHGYDLNAVTFLNKYQFVSAADEKVLRVFDAPRGVIDMIHALAKEEEAVLQERPHCATLPALGLSNKAVYDDTASPSSEPVFHPPLEPTLLTQTLWPEKDKLYGHGYEIVSIASTHDGSYFVSASKASKPEHASVIVWSGETKRQVCKLAGHGLTVTAMAFSPDDKFLVTVSRDRGICLYEKTGLDKEPYKLSALHNKAHARIIWDCAWTSTGSHFVTVSRDKSMKLWALTSQCEPKEMLIVKMDDAITSCDIAPCQSERLIMAALGLENGRVIVMTLKEAEDDIWKVESQISYPESLCHAGPVNSLKFRPSVKEGPLLLASASDDHSFQIVRLAQ